MEVDFFVAQTFQFVPLIEPFWNRNPGRSDFQSRSFFGRSQCPFELRPNMEYFSDLLPIPKISKSRESRFRQATLPPSTFHPSTLPPLHSSTLPFFHPSILPSSYPANPKIHLHSFPLYDTLFKPVWVALLRDGNPTPFSATLPP